MGYGAALEAANAGDDKHAMVRPVCCRARAVFAWWVSLMDRRGPSELALWLATGYCAHMPPHIFRNRSEEQGS